MTVTTLCTPLAIYDGDDLLFLNHPSPSPERPEQLVAATCLEINGVKTATIPAEMCSDAQALIPLYHECFHVYQEIGHFQFSRQFDFFRALAFYPELDSAYRALCHAEAQIYNDAELTLQDKGVRLAALARHRYQILAEREGLLAFEKDSERREGTAFFVEQKARSRREPEKRGHSHSVPRATADFPFIQSPKYHFAGRRPFGSHRVLNSAE